MNRREPELAFKGAYEKTITNAAPDVTACTTSSQTDATLLAPYAGRWVFLQAVGGDVTYLRGSHTVVAGYGHKLTDGGAPHQWFIYPGDDTTLSFIASASCDLVILFDE